MDRPLSILLIEDDPAECAAIAQYIETTEDAHLVQVTNNADRALEYVREHLPDAIILDLELHKGGGNGISFLMALREEALPFSPYILVTTHNISGVTHNKVRQLGVDFVMTKNQDDYSAKTVIDFLRVFKETIQDARRSKQKPGEPENLPPAQARQRLLAQLTMEIDLVGISPKVMGRKYLIDTMMLMIEGTEQNVRLAVAQKHGKSESSVERAMQTAIQRAWTTANLAELQKYYTARINPNRGVPTLTEFLFHYVNKYKKEE